MLAGPAKVLSIISISFLYESHGVSEGRFEQNLTTSAAKIRLLVLKLDSSSDRACNLRLESSPDTLCQQSRIR